jgi:TolB protein
MATSYKTAVNSVLDPALGIMVMALSDAGYTHIFAYQPEDLPLTRLTSQPWDDRDPVLSPDASRIAYTSRQNGYWDLFSLELTTGQPVRLTDTGEFEGSPSWSPDSLWLVYETFQSNRFQLAILSVDHPGQAPIPLTQDRASNHSPAWSPQGRKIAYIATQDGLDQLRVTDLDQLDNPASQVTRPQSAQLQHPAWSPDGRFLAWAQVRNGDASLYLWDTTQPSTPGLRLGNGDWPVWSPDGTQVATRICTPNQEYLSIYSAADGRQVLPPELLPGQLVGFDWKSGRLPHPLPAPFQQAQAATPPPQWTEGSTTFPPGADGHTGLKLLPDVSAPQASLSERASGSFNSLRQRIANELGWDYLSSLENAFVPITSPLSPGLEDDWLYTGRAFSANTLPIRAGWMMAARDDFGNQTYWRIYLKTRYQDGSQGAPVEGPAWDLTARYTGDPAVYEQGGTPSNSPLPGYWVDLTQLAVAYGWERLPALNNWRTFFPAARLAEFIYPQGLNWAAAMMELYPPEAMITATPKLSPAPTSTPAPSWYRTRTPTKTPLPTTTSTRRPTWTPLVSQAP